MNAVFADTVGLLALWDRSDQWHEAADAAYQEVVGERLAILTTSFVLLECGNSAARRPYRRQVDRLRRDLEAAGLLIHPNSRDWNDAWRAFAEHRAEGPGIVDQFSFIVMRRFGIMRAFTNDRHSRNAGFQTMF